MIADLDRALDEGFAAAVEDIRTAIRIPGVSKTGEDLVEMADWLMVYLSALGAEVDRAPGEVAPILHGRIGDTPDRPTLLFYDLYDVQLANPAEWRHPPFAAEIENGRLIGRGAFNSKGPLIGFLSVLRDIRAAERDLPCNIRFVIEGEEEIGSPSLEPFLRALRMTSPIVRQHSFLTWGRTRRGRRSCAWVSRA